MRILAAVVLFCFTMLQSCVSVTPSSVADGDTLIANRLNQVQLGMNQMGVMERVGRPSGEKVILTSAGKDEVWSYSLGTLMTNLLTQQEQFNMGMKYQAQGKSPYFIRAVITFSDGQVSAIER